ncbi:MAG: glycosyltransferase family 4 protein [Chloroflexi bacterium]|nr:glycosyltransferase family 4 protein [Chloroflexota bacterium]
MKRLRIGISARGLNSFASGPNEYIAGLTGEMVRQAAGRHAIFIYYNTSRLLGRFAAANERVVPGNNAFLWDHLFLPLALLRDHLDLVIHPKGTIPLWSPAGKVPIMLDLGYFYPSLNAYKPSATLYTRTAMKFAARHSALIFTISEFTRRDVIRLLKVEPKRIYNLYGAASEQYQRVKDASRLEAVRKKYNLPDTFIFYPTNLSPRKNFPRLLEAFEKVQEKIPHHLYFTGQVSWNTKELDKQLERLSARVHRMGQVPVEDMAALYSLAQFAIYPSLFEGLGLPILEAFQCGTPLMVSDQTSIPEVAGDAALIVDAYSVESIAQGLIKMASDAKLRQRLISAGYEQAQLFTWEKSVKILLDAVESNF